MSNATCSDTDGSFYCNCTEGFEGNGTYCDGNLWLVFNLRELEAGEAEFS